MPQGRTLHVTLSADKMSSERRKAEDQVLEDVITDLQLSEDEVERWLREVAVPAYERILADPSRGIILEQVEEYLGVRRSQRRAKRA